MRNTAREQSCEGRVAMSAAAATTTTTTTTTTTASMKGLKKRYISTPSPAPRSLDLWSSRTRKGEENNLSSLGLSQMQGYEDLENMNQAPMQWADDEERVVSTSKAPISTIAFPTASDEPSEPSVLRESVEAKGIALREHQNQLYHSSSSIRQRGPTSMRQRHRQSESVSAIFAPDSSTSSPYDSYGTTSADSSGCSSPEGKTASLNQLSLRQRSMKSLQGIASAWVPAAVRSPYESENEANRALQADKETLVEEKRPVRLDRRRLNKAVSLAMEAAQASEQKEKAWKKKKKRRRSKQLARQQSCLDLQHTPRANREKGRFTSLPWRRSHPIVEDGLGIESQKALVPVRKRMTGTDSDDDDDDDDDGSSGVTKRAGSQDDEESDESDASANESEGEDFSIDLYLSSLSYLLTALNPKDVDNVGSRQRDEMRRKLEEALYNLEDQQSQKERSIDREEVIRLRVERELVMLEQVYHQESDRRSLPNYRAHQAAIASSNERVRKQSLAGYLTSSAIDLGLSVGAGALAAASRGVASLVPILTAGTPKIATEGVEQSGNVGGESAVEGSLVTPPSSSELSVRSSRAAATDDPARSLFTSSQWELTRTLAHSVASTMYNNIAAVAEQRRPDLQGSSSTEMALYDPALPPEAIKGEDASDRLLLLAATLGRNVKRSPLPSQVKVLASQVVSLLAALDERYAFSRRSADIALRKTGQALYYVRKNDLHVKALRTVWAVVEASVAAIEAYRDEEEWKGEVISLPAKKIEQASR